MPSRKRRLPNIQQKEAREVIVPEAQRLPVVAVEGTVLRAQITRGKTVIPAIVAPEGGLLVRPATASRTSWDDPDDKNERSKTPKQVLGYRRVDPILTLTRTGSLSKDQFDAAEHYRDDYEAGVEGARPGYQRPEVRGSSGACGPAEAQLIALESYRGATLAVGIRLGAPLVEIVLGRDDVSAYAERRGISRHKAMGYLEAALDRLQDFYDGSGNKTD